MGRYCEFPNLELLEYKTQQILRNHLKKHQYFNLKADMFMQLWGSTCLGIDIMPDGSPAIGGSAMTEAYTTVFHEPSEDVYVVFFGNSLAYIVSNAPETFFEDLKNHTLVSVSEANKKY